MGRTILGIDVDEAPLGGLIERLLDDDALEKLAETDGGHRDDRRDDEGDDSTDDGDERSRTDAGSSTDDDHDSSGRLGSLGGVRSDSVGDGGRLVGRLRRGLLYLGAGTVLVGLLAVLVKYALKRVRGESADDRRRSEQKYHAETDVPPEDHSREAAGAVADEHATGGTTDGDSTLGELIALALLALIAAVVRKFDESGDHESDP